MTWAEKRAAAELAALERPRDYGFGPGFTQGNRKLGQYVFTWSRPYGMSCPQDCPLLDAACYADHKTRGPLIGSMYLGALARFGYAPPFATLPAGAMVRLHVSGDFVGPDGLMDRPYIDAVVKGLRARPDLDVWSYTHAWAGSALHELRDLMSLFASVGSDADAAKAAALGWRLAYEGPHVGIAAGDSSGRVHRVGGDGDNRPQVLAVCPEQTGAADSCADCGICHGSAPAGLSYRRRIGGVAFKRH